MKMRWISRLGYKIGGQAVRFRGRTPFTPIDQNHRKNLLGIGVFEELLDGTLRYCAPIRLRCKHPKDQQCTWVDKDGFVEVDMDHLAQDLVDNGIQYELQDPEKEVAPCVWTDGVDNPNDDLNPAVSARVKGV